ncbi:aspartyl-phosphate phosphatase Spo0E family protein [Salibacterium salarium]|uniref:Aspartyl-phosphate phosphatase Spo0E family protein n=1 Tax=Salibacterium salarium TaxID=284579 RepID=A0A428N3L7_9BACI|nr:aspartyl-phosphate phosphatase Spo0E family protein [Salibacterium salarium]RSL32877.1 aspartyl-phosphate phosphatase Spo0E family protein [Salibacterium salarium]
MTVQEIEKNKLEHKIKTLRIRMVYNGQSKGLTHPDTIKYSQELDVYLNQYYHIQSL